MKHESKAGLFIIVALCALALLIPAFASAAYDRVVVENMTGYYAPTPYTVWNVGDRTGVPAGLEPWHLFDTKTGDGSGGVGSFQANNPPQRIYFNLGSGNATVVTAYNISSSGYAGGSWANYVPTHWYVYGSNDNSTWTQLSSVQGFSWGVAGYNKTHQFNFTNSVAYRYYQLQITGIGSNASGAMLVGEWMLLKETSAPAAPSGSLSMQVNDTRTSNLISGFTYSLTNGTTTISGYCASSSCSQNTTNITSGSLTVTNISGGNYENTTVSGITFNTTNSQTIVAQTFQSYITLANMTNIVDGTYQSYTASVTIGGNTVNVYNNGSQSIPVYHTIGAVSVLFHNITGGTFYNVTDDLGTYNSTTSVLYHTTYQAKISLRAYQLHTNNTINTFNATLGLVTNTTDGTKLLPANVGANTVQVAVPGNYSQNITCTVAAAHTTTDCNATGFYDTRYTIGANYGGSSVSTFTVTATNATLGGILYEQDTTNGSVTLALLQGYYYNFLMDTTVHSLENATLAANSTAQTYNFTVYTTNTFDINFKNESTNTAASGNVTVELISDAFAGNYTTTNGSLTVSLLTPGSYTIRYWREASVPREYYTTLEPQSYNTITLYLLDSDVSNIYIPKVVDQSGKRKANATVQLMRYYVDCNCYRTVEMAKTDTNGNAVMRVVPNVVPYKLLISSGGYSITTQPTKFTDQTNTYTLNLLSNPLESIQALPSISRSLSYNNATYTYTYTWTDTSGLVIQGCLNVQKFSRGRQTTAHNSCSSGTSGSIIYTINDTNQTSYTATGSVQTSTQYSYYYDQSQISFTTTGASVFGLVGMLIFMILLLVMISIGAETGTDTIIIMTLIGTIGLGAFGIITASWSVLVPIIIVGAFAVYKTRT